MSEGKMPFGKVEDKVLYRWLAIIGVVAIVAIAMVVVVPRLMEGASQASAVAEQAAAAAKETAAVLAKEAAIPAEAKKWVSEFGARYADPVSTYYSELGYESKYKTTLMMADSYISTYDPKGDKTFPSALGFTMVRLPLSDGFNQAYSVQFFNDYIAPNMSRYMNLRAKNPGAAGALVVEDHFLDSCAGATENRNGNTSNAAANVRGRKLLDLMNAIVDELGSNAVYTVAPAASLAYSKDTATTTYFDSDTPTMVWPDGSAYSDNNLVLLIDVDVYAGKTASHVHKFVDDVQITVERQPHGNTDTSTFMSIGRE